MDVINQENSALSFVLLVPSLGDLNCQNHAMQAWPDLHKS